MKDDGTGGITGFLCTVGGGAGYLIGHFLAPTVSMQFLFEIGGSVAGMILAVALYACFRPGDL